MPLRLERSPALPAYGWPPTYKPSAGLSLGCASAVVTVDPWPSRMCGLTSSLISFHQIY
jgi:hypothetical protein